MKKTYNINLNGQVFCIDEDAYQKLQSYIDTLEKHYLKEEGGKEIMSDIENRIAELLKETLGKSYKQVVSLADIDHIVQIMGSPDVIIDEDPENGSGPIKRKLYRDPDESILGGVASGIAAYFDISVVWVRLAFVLLVFFYGMTIVAYIILWIVMPVATTSRQKLEMKGEKVNVSNIEKNIRDTYDGLKKNSSLQQCLATIGNGIKTLFRKLGSIFGKLSHLVLLILSVIGLVGGSFLFLLTGWVLLYPEHLTNFTIYHILYSAITPNLLIGLKVILFLTLNIPILLLIYVSAHYLFRFTCNRIFLLTAIGCWFLAGFIGIIIALQQGLSYADTTENTKSQLLTTVDTASHKYTLTFKDLPQSDHQANLIRCSRHFANVLAFDSIPPKEIYLKAYMDVTSGLSAYPSVSIQKKVRGTYNHHNLDYLNQIHYQWENRDNQLSLDTYFKIIQPTWKGQEVKVTLSIPEGDTLVIHGNCKIEKNRLQMELPFRKYRDVYTAVMKNGRLEMIE